MKTSAIYTRKIMGLDNNVLLLLLIFLILSLCLLAYGLSGSTRQQSEVKVHFTINGLPNSDDTVYSTDDLLLFRTPVSPENNVIWDFGDNSEKEEGFTVSHNFKEAGIYSVTATVNGIFVSVKKIKVNRAAAATETIADNPNVIAGNERPVTGKIEKYITSLPASSYEWTIENDPNVAPRYTQKTSFKFRVAGNYIVKLVLDSDKQKTYRKYITVIDDLDNNTKGGEIKPGPLLPGYVVVTPNAEKEPVSGQEPVNPSPVAPTPVSTIKKPMYVDDAIFKEDLQSFVCGESKQDAFSKYLCDGGDTKVVVDKNKEIKTFQSLCAAIQPGKKGPKRIEIKHVELIRDNNCIIIIKVAYDEKGGLLPGKGPCSK